MSARLLDTHGIRAFLERLSGLDAPARHEAVVTACLEGGGAFRLTPAGGAALNGGDLVTLNIAGTRYVIADIGMRMLTPRELFTAQGFPKDYVIEGVWDQASDGSWDWRSFTKNTQVSCVGNSVCPPVAAAVVKANCGQLVERED